MHNILIFPEVEIVHSTAGKGTMAKLLSHGILKVPMDLHFSLKSSKPMYGKEALGTERVL